MQESFCLWQLCPSESWVWRWCSCLACGDPGGAKCTGTRTASTAGVMGLSESFFEPLVAWWSEGFFGQSFSVALPFKQLEGSLACGPVVRRIRHIKGRPGWGPGLWFTVSGIWWASLSIVKLPMLTCGGREAMVMAQPAMHDSAVSSCFHGCLAFLHRHFPPQSPLSHPLDPTLCSQQQSLHWDCSTILRLQLPATAPSKRPTFLPGICMAVARIVWFSLHLGCHRSAVSLSALNVSSLTQTITPLWGSDPCFRSPTCWG